MGTAADSAVGARLEPDTCGERKLTSQQGQGPLMGCLGIPENSPARPLPQPPAVPVLHKGQFCAACMESSFLSLPAGSYLMPCLCQAGAPVSAHLHFHSHSLCPLRLGLDTPRLRLRTKGKERGPGRPSRTGGRRGRPCF